MKKSFALLVVLAAACATQAPKPIVVDEQTRGAIKQLTDAVAQQPTNAPYIYILATYHDRAGETAEVVKWLGRLDELGWQHGVSPIAFKNSRGSAFRNVVARLDAKEPRANDAKVAFTLKGHRDLVPEGIAYDPVDDVFYVSGIYRRKVLRVTRDGNATDFIKEAQDGMLGGLGMKIDRNKRHLWVISSTTKEMRGYVKDQESSMLAAYDLRDGSLIRKLDPAPARLNDLTILDDGTIFATDMGTHTVVKLAPDATTFEKFADGFLFPNGITNDGTHLYVGDFRGIHRFVLADKTRTRIDVPNQLLGGIDGLDFHQGTLIGIQNSLGNPRVIRLHLDTNRLEILESKNKLFELPTTGAIANGEYFFIANPGLRSFEDDGTIWPEAKLQDPVMLKIPIR
jgi:sugar lactone lactonase YvrE